MGDLARAERELATVAPEVGSSIQPDSPPAMMVLQVQAHIDAARGRVTEAIADVSKIVEFFDSRQMAVAGAVRALNLRGDLYLRAGNSDAAMVDAQRARDISRSLQGDKPYSSYTGQALLRMARIDESRGDLSGARDLASQAIPQLTETLGATHPETLRAEQFAVQGH